MGMKPNALVGLCLTVFILVIGAVGIAACTGPSPSTLPSATPAVASSVSTAPPTSVATPVATPAASPLPSATAGLTPTSASTPTAEATAQPVLSPQDFPIPPVRDPIDLARRLRPGWTPYATPSAPPDYKVGDSTTFWLIDQGSSKSAYQVTARIAYITDHAYFYVADGVNIPPASLKASADIFEKQTYPLLHKYFGSEPSPGIDNDVHITILNAHIPGVGGYFSSLDSYPRSVNPYSNQREMVYMNVDSSMPGTRTYDSTLAHEFTHMIQRNIMSGGETWIKEGSAEVGALAAGQQSGGLDALFVRDPDIQLTQWAETAAQSGAHYGAAYLFMLYYAQHFGGYGAVGKLLANDGRGEASFNQALASQGIHATFESIFKDWVVANYLDDKSIGNGQYGYNPRRPQQAAAETVRTLPYHASTTVSNYGTHYYALQPSPGDLTITFDGRENAKLLDLDAHSGKVQWWSNRGDEIDSTLTRKVDLTGTQKATLKFWTWFDIEEDYDYAFVLVSVDNGKTWTTIPGKYTTTANPNGGNFGYGYTGKSGGTAPAWVHESMDLSAYAGKQILLRFEYVTDDAYNAQGIGLDDFEIPEIGWKDNAETAGDWVANGFVRTDNNLQQRFAVQVITKGAATKVQQMELDSQDKGQLVIRNVGPGRDVQSVVVAVSGLAPLTIRPAEYQISMTMGTPTTLGTPTTMGTPTPTAAPKQTPKTSG